DLPDGSYTVWVRGYGLDDSTPVEVSRGQRIALEVSRARSLRDAARIFPSNYWLSLYRPPEEARGPRSDARQDSASSPATANTVGSWIANMKLTCIRCHQFGAPVFQAHISTAAWEHAWMLRPNEGRAADWLGRDPLTRTLADWSSRIQEGAVPL